MHKLSNILFDLLISVSKEDMEKLRQALKTLSEAEKQLRLSTDKLTWLTAALLQLAPDQQYTLPTSSSNTSLNHSPMAENNVSDRNLARHSVNKQEEMLSGGRGLLRGVGLETSCGRGANGMVHSNNKANSSYLHEKKNVDHAPGHPMSSVGPTNAYEGYKSARNQNDKKIWRLVLENIQSDALRQFLLQEGKLVSVSLGAGKISALFNLLYSMW